MRISASCPPSRLYEVGLTVTVVVVTRCLLHPERVRLDVDQERAGPGPPSRRSRWTPRPGSRASSTSVGPPSADWSTLATTSGVPANGTYQSRAVVALAGSAAIWAGVNCWLLPDPRSEQPGLRRLDVVRLVDLAERLDRIVVSSTNTVIDVTFFGSSSSSTIFHTPFVDLKLVSRLCAAVRPTRVDDVDDVLHAGPLVVGDVLDPDELEHVEVAPVLEHPLGAVDARGPGDGREAKVERQVPSVGGSG